MQLDHGGLRRRGRPLNKDLFKLNLRDLIELGHAIDGTFAPERGGCVHSRRLLVSCLPFH